MPRYVAVRFFTYQIKSLDLKQNVGFCFKKEDDSIFDSHEEAHGGEVACATSPADRRNLFNVRYPYGAVAGPIRYE